MSRMTPLTPPFPPEIQQAFDAIMPRGVPPFVLFTTLARNPRVYAKFNAGGLLDKGTLTLRDREIVIDRTTARCGSEYEWGVHVVFFAQRAGLSPDQVRATVRGTDGDPVWPPREVLLIRLVDSLHDRADVDDALWNDLRAHFSDEQLIELIALTGFYHTVSFFTNALRLPLEDYAERFPGR
jgi:alkylhydroperoxidase family enzyme